MTSAHRPRFLAIAAAAAIAGCSGSTKPAGPANTTPTDPGSAQTVAVAIAPEQVTVLPGQTVPFTATVTGTADTSVAWNVDEAQGGTITSDGLYTAPVTAGTYHVTVTSRADNGKSRKSKVIVVPPGTVVIEVAPAAASVSACQTLQLAATVSGTTDTAVTWAVQEGAAGGTVSAAGLYTAPAAAGTFHVVGTSHADATKTSTATLTVQDAAILAVAVTPGTVTLAPGGTAQLTATVTTTCGTYNTSGTLLSSGTIVPN
jgi:hypothetical protein